MSVAAAPEIIELGWTGLSVRSASRVFRRPFECLLSLF